MAGGEDSEENNSESESEADPADLEKNDPLVTNQELKRLEDMLKAGNTKTAKCPFPKPSLGRISTQSARAPEKPLNHQQLTQMIEKSGGECPFKFAMKPDADSEDEADVPKHHIKNGNCPLNKRGTHDQNMREVKPDSQSMEEGKPNDDTSEGINISQLRPCNFNQLLLKMFVGYKGFEYLWINTQLQSENLNPMSERSAKPITHQYPQINC